MSIPPEAIEPVANATKAVAETAGKALDIVSGAGRFLDRLVGNALAEGGETLADQVRYWRKMRLLKFEEKFNAACAARGFSPDTMKPLSLGKTVQLLEAASIEEEDEVQELWADLLANAVDPAGGVTMKKMYVTLLKDMGPAEAVLVDLLGKFRAHRQLPPAPMNAIHRQLEDVERHLRELTQQRWAKFSQADREGAISNLRRLGCVAPNFEKMPPLGRLLTQVRLDGGGARIPLVSQIDPQELQRLVNWIAHSLSVAGGGAEPKLPETVEYRTESGFRVGQINVPELNLQLTPVGADLVDACAKPRHRSSATSPGHEAT